MLNADQFGQGPNVPTQRFLARLAFILNYTHLESIFTSLIQEAPCKTLDIIIANSLNGATGTGIFIDLAYLFRSIKKIWKNKIPINQYGIFLLRKCYVDSYLYLSNSMNSYFSLKELEFFMNPSNSYAPNFLGKQARSIQKKPFNFVHLFEEFESIFQYSKLFIIKKSHFNKR